MTQLGTKKSRKGCTQCKRRRVKCDEGAPCGNCLRRSEQCSLLYPPSPDGTNDSALPTDNEEWLSDLELMHHYSHRTCRSNLGAGTRIQYLWQEHIPAEAVKQPFLMHGVLALAALHLASIRPLEASKYARLCDKHQATALTSYRSVLGHITPDVANATFALSTILSISSLARGVLRASMSPDRNHIPLDDVTELFFLTRGVREIKEASAATVVNGPFSVMFYGYTMSADIRVTLSPRLREMFSDLDRMSHENCAETDHLRLCLQATDDLKEAYENLLYFCSTGKLEMGHIWRWTASLPYDFLKLMQSGFAPTLVITAHFCVASLMMRTTWYVSNWGKLAFEGISVALAGRLEEHLQWAREQLATELVGLKHNAATIETVESHQPPPEGVELPIDPQAWADQWSTEKQDYTPTSMAYDLPPNGISTPSNIP